MTTDLADALSALAGALAKTRYPLDVPGAVEGTDST